MVENTNRINYSNILRREPDLEPQCWGSAQQGQGVPGLALPGLHRVFWVFWVSLGGILHFIFRFSTFPIRVFHQFVSAPMVCTCCSHWLVNNSASCQASCPGPVGD